MPSEPKKGADFLAALSECPDCGGPRRDTGGQVLEYHHTKTCARVLDVQKLFADLSPAVVPMEPIGTNGASDPVFVPEERQDEARVATADELRAFLRNLRIDSRAGDGGRIARLASALDALAVAVKETGFDAASSGRDFALLEMNEETVFVVLRKDSAEQIRSAITALLDGRTTT